MPDLPTGTVTFLLTDIVGSTRLWAEAPAAMRAASVRHDEIIEAAVAQHGGVVVRPRGEGDSRFAVFARATDAAAAAIGAQLAIEAEPWPDGVEISVRIGLHAGEADVRDGDYYGPAVNRCARLREIAHGGQAVVSQTVADLVRDAPVPDVTLRDLGQHALRDLAVPERVFQLCHPQLPDTFPPLRSLSRLPTNLPAQLTSFVGREQEMAEVSRLLVPTRLLTLTGSGGCGKTRLAMQVAADLLDRYPDGVWLVELAGVGDPALVPQTVAAALGVREEAGRDLSDTLVGYLRGRETLLILDNCEHLVEAAAQIATTILRACPDVQILATSREPLDVPGETTWVVPSMTVPDAREPLASLERFEAVRLFIERAQQAHPSLRLNERTATAVIQICRRLDGIPLAIELAAARAKVLSVDQIAARLDDRFRLLGETRGAIPRHETLAAAVAWSYDLLGEDERTVFRRLGVFQSGFTEQAAIEVCGGDGLDPGQISPVLMSLVEKSLALRLEGEGDERFALLETVRQFAEERLADAGERGTYRSAHLRYFADLTAGAVEEMRGPRQAAWLDVLEAEHDNLRAALDHAAVSGKAAEGLAMATSLAPFWEIRAYLSEGRRRLEALLALDTSVDPGLRGAALGAAGALAHAMGDYDAARAFQESSLRHQRDATGGWPSRVAARAGSMARRSVVVTVLVALVAGAVLGVVAGRVTRSRAADIFGRDDIAQSMLRFRSNVRWILTYGGGPGGRNSAEDEPGVLRDAFPRFRLSAGWVPRGEDLDLCLRLTGGGRQIDGDGTDPHLLCEPSVPRDAPLSYCVCPVPWDRSIRAVWGAARGGRLIRPVRIRLRGGQSIDVSPLHSSHIQLTPPYEGDNLTFGLDSAGDSGIAAYGYLSFIRASSIVESIEIIDGLGRVSVTASIPAACQRDGSSCMSALEGNDG